MMLINSVSIVAYPATQVFYNWHDPTLAVGYEGKLQLSQFDIINTKYRQINYSRSDATGSFSVLQVVFVLQRHTGYFLIQVSKILSSHYFC